MASKCPKAPPHPMRGLQGMGGARVVTARVTRSKCCSPEVSRKPQAGFYCCVNGEGGNAGTVERLMDFRGKNYC